MRKKSNRYVNNVFFRIKFVLKGFGTGVKSFMDSLFKDKLLILVSWFLMARRKSCFYMIGSLEIFCTWIWFIFYGKTLWADNSTKHFKVTVRVFIAKRRVNHNYVFVTMVFLFHSHIYLNDSILWEWNRKQLLERSSKNADKAKIILSSGWYILTFLVVFSFF